MAANTTPLLLQKSSVAGYIGLTAGALNMLAVNGVPANTAGWVGFAATLLASVAAILADERGPAKA